MADSNDDGISVTPAGLDPGDRWQINKRPSCGECGSVIANVELHTAWHSGADQGDAQGAVLDFLAAVDVSQLQAAVMQVLEEGDVDPIAATLDLLKALAAR